MKTIFTLVVLSIAILTSAQVASFEQKIKSPDPGFTSEMFGNKVAIDGDIMVVSDPRDRHDLTGQVSQAIIGAVYVYRKDANGDWVFEQKLRHPNVTFNSNFSFDLAVKNNLIVVGSNGHQTNANGGFTLNGAGSVFIYRYNTNTSLWEFASQLVSTDRQTGARFGASVAFSGNNELIVGEYGRNGTNPNVIGAGRAYVYVVANDGNATLRQIINNPEPGNDDFFGWTVTGDGTQIAIAAIYDDIGTGVNLVDRAGSIYMYEKDAANQYIFTQKITASNPRQSALYGNSMALQNDVLIVGAPDESTQFTNGVQSYGAAYAYKNINGTWQESDRFLPQGLVPGGRFGWSVSLDNNQVLISHHKGSNPPSVFNGPGIVFLYQLDPITGTRTQTSIVESPFPATSAAFGLSCVIQNGLITVGAFGDSTDLQGVYDEFNVGAVYTYTTSSTASMNEQDREVVKLYPNPATDFIRLQTTGTGTYLIHNTLGQMVLHGNYVPNDQPISITSLKTGLFFITLETAGNKQVIKFLKR